MVAFKSGEKVAKPPAVSHGLVSSMVLTNSRDKISHPQKQTKVGEIVKNITKEIKAFDSMVAADHVTDSDAKSTSASKNKQGYFNVIKSLHIGQCRDASSSEDEDIKIIKSNDRLNKTMINLNLSKQTTPKVSLPRLIPKSPSKDKESLLRGLDMVTEMSSHNLMLCLEGVFRHMGLDPFVVGLQTNVVS